MELQEIVNKRYAAKKFDGKTIPPEKMDELLEIIRMAASSFGLQPWRIKVVTDAATKEKLKPASFGQEQITTCSHLLVFCADPELEKLIGKMGAAMRAAGLPEAMVSGMAEHMLGWAKGLDEQKRIAWAKNQVYLALGNALNGAASLGLDSCPMEGFSADEYQKILAIPKPLTVAVICPVGYAADTPHAKVRFPLRDILL